MPRLTSSKKTRYISFDMLRPSVDLASCHRWTKNTSHQYCVPSHHLLLIESGRIYVNSKDGKFDAVAGDLVCFRPTNFNEYGNVEPSLLYQIHLHFAPPPRNRLTPWLDDVGPLPIRLPLGDAFDDVRRLFEIVLADLREPGVTHRCRVIAAIFEMLGVIARVGATQNVRATKPDSWERLRVRLAADLSETVNIRSLSKQMGMSREHLMRRFKERFGLSPKAYHNELRIREAARRLREGDRQIKSIAFDLGFSNPKYFARLFRRFLGISPTDLRANNTELNSTDPHAGRLYSLNEFVVPLGTERNWLQRYSPSKR